MIPNRWYAALSEKELRGRNLLGFKRFGLDLALWRRKDGTYVCLSDRCCHRGASLSHGSVVDDQLYCPFHGMSYDETGHVRQIPANGKNMQVQERFHVRRFPTQVKYGFLWIYYGDENQMLPDVPFVDELKSGYIYSEFSEVWPVHYTRAVENQLDVAHLPFVHNTTIGRGQKTLVHGPVVIWEEEKMTFYVKNANDEGTKTPQKPDEIRPYEQLFSLQYQAPNIWQNRISDKLRIVAAFAPIDDDHTRIYLRTYQSMVKVPLVGNLLANVLQLSNKVILHQDRRVVIGQKPVKSALRMDENLIQADLPIIEFRRKREELQRTEISQQEGESDGTR